MQSASMAAAVIADNSDSGLSIHRATAVVPDEDRELLVRLARGDEQAANVTTRTGDLDLALLVNGPGRRRDGADHSLERRASLLERRRLRRRRSVRHVAEHLLNKGL